MGKNIGWRPRRGHLVACALSILAMAAGSSSTVAGDITSVVVPTEQIYFTCNLLAPFMSLPTHTASASSSGTAAVDEPNGASGTACGDVKMYEIGSVKLTAALNVSQENPQAPPLDAKATSTLSNVKLLGGIVEYTTKNATTECPADAEGQNYVCENRVVYTGLKFAGLSRTFPLTSSTVTYRAVSYPVVAVLAQSVCGKESLTVAEFTGTLTMNTATIGPAPGNAVLTYIPLRLRGTLLCVTNLKTATVDIQDVVQLTGDFSWTLLYRPQYVTAN